MENLPIDAIDLPSRVFYSPNEDKLYFGEVGDYKEVPNLDDIPTKTSDLTNDGDGVSPFITEAEADLKYVESDDLGSAAFEDSDVEPITGTIPLRYGLGEGRIKVGNGIFEKDAVNRSQLDALAVGRVRVESYVIALDKSQINNLHTTPISVLWSDMGLDNNHVVRWRPELTAVKIDDDGTPFFGSSPIHVGRFPIQGVISIHPTRYGVSGIYSAFPVQNSVHVGVEPEFYIETASEITGGGANSRIEIMIFFEIDTITF